MGVGFSKHVCFAFNAVCGGYDWCFTGGKDRRWFWGQKMVNFAKQSENPPVCGIDTSYFLSLFNTFAP